MGRNSMHFAIISVAVAMVMAVSVSLAMETTHSEDGYDTNSSNKSSHKSGGHHGGIHVASFQFDYVKQPLVVSLFMIAVVFCKLGFHHANFLSSWMPESCVLIILGTVVGGILHAANVDASDFYYIHPQSFFLFLLPPCILEAAYGLHDPVFFENLGTILLFAVVGTILNCFIIGPVLFGLAMCGAMGTIQITLIECLVFSSLIVAVDPVAVLAIFQEIGVNSVLYFLVFGESLLNDAVTVVLYNTITTLSTMEEAISATDIGLAVAAFFTVSLGGLSIGIVFGILSALVTRLTQHVRAVEPLAIFSFAYAAYLMAELFHFSGIISMIGCGLVQVQYAFHNISHNSMITVKYFSKMLSGACDSIIFMFLGVALVRDDHVWNTGFVLWSALLCLLVRFLVTYFLTFIANRTNRVRKVDTQEQFIMAYGGLRGAVAFCLVAMLGKEFGNKFMFQTATLFVILFTVFIQGITIKPLVKLLRIKGDEKVVSIYQEINDHVFDHILVFMEEVIGHYGHNTFKEWLDKIDDNYLKRWLQRDPLTKDQVIMELYQEIALQQHFENLYGVDLSSSRLELYQPAISDMIEVNTPLHPEVMRRSMDNFARTVMAAQRLSRLSQHPRSMSTDDEERDRSVYDTVKSLPAVMARGSVARPELNRFLSYTEEDMKDKKQKSKRSRFSKLGESNQDNAFKPNPTSKDLRKWMIKSPNKDVFTRKEDKNMTNADEGDLLRLLHAKQLRHERYIRTQSVFSPAVTPQRQVSPAGSISGLPDEEGKNHEEGRQLLKSGSADDKESEERGPRMRHHTLETGGAEGMKEDRRLRVRHKTVDFEGPQGHVKYIPRYVSRRPIAAYAYRGPQPEAPAASSSKVRLPSIDETQSASVVNETLDKKARSKSESSGQSAAGDAAHSTLDEEKASLIADQQEQDMLSVSHRGRGHLQRQDADDVKPMPLQRLNTNEL